MTLLEYYGLEVEPFGVTPDPKFLYLGASHREALASLFYGVETGRGLVVLIAPPGMGKTTLLFRLLEYLKPSARTAFLFQTQCDSVGLLRYVLADLGIETQDFDFVAMHERLNQELLRQRKSGRRFVLIIDEAQNLSESVLETARLLSDFETPSDKLLQIVLAGQSQLADKLLEPTLAQLRQRVAVVAHLDPLSAAEVYDYVESRLGVAGGSSSALFTPAALGRISEISQGVPRRINHLCFNTLSLGYALLRKRIDADVVDLAAADLDIGPLTDAAQHEALHNYNQPFASIGASTRRPLVSSSISYAAKRERTIRRSTVAAAVFLVALLTAVLYRHDLSMVAASPGKAAPASVDVLTPRKGQLVDAKPLSRAADSNSQRDEPDEPSLKTNAVVAISPVAPRHDPSNQSKFGQANHVRTEFPHRPVVVVVRSGDDLRQICLRYVGTYTTSLVEEIQRFNPELTDPNRILVGQRIALPKSSHAPRLSSPVASP